MGRPFLKNILRILYTDPAHLSTGSPCIPLDILCTMHGILCKRAQPMAAPLRLSKKWLAPLFRGLHSSLAPTARPGSYAGKPLLRKAFCGFAVHAAKSDYSLRGGKAERRQWREERGGSPVSKGAPGRPHGPTQRDLCELHCGPRTPGGFRQDEKSPKGGFFYCRC